MRFFPSPLKRGHTARLLLAAAIATVLIGTAAALFFALHKHQLEARLLTTEADDLPADATLVNFAFSLAPPLYAANCASCHGEDLHGRANRNVPSLRTRNALYDSSTVASLERTILYGIRSGHAMARNVTDMPAMGLSGQLQPDQVRDVAAYILSLSSPVADKDAILRGKQIYRGDGNCFDCHTGDGSGNQDYGAPAFDGHWLYGGDPGAIYHSIFYGRHGLCPAWVNRLKPAEIRALALYLFALSHEDAVPRARFSNAEKPNDM